MAKKEAQQVKNTLEKVNMSLLKGDAHINWMKLLKPIKDNLSKIHKTQEIKIQRKSFLQTVL